MTFVAEEVALQVIRALRGTIIETIAKRDRDLEDQIRRAATSAALNAAEGWRREGKDRLHLFRVALGSAGEVRTALRVAAAWGYIAGETAATVAPPLDHLIAVLWKLAHPC